MNQKILGEQKKSNFDENLHEIVNELYENMPDKVPNSSTEKSEIIKDPFLALGLEIEKKAFRNVHDVEKELFSFEDSLKSIKYFNYERHLRIHEMILLLMNHFWGPNDRTKEICEDILRGKGEWLSLVAVVPDKGTVSFFEDPENLIRDMSANSYKFNGGALKSGKLIVSGLFPDRRKPIKAAYLDDEFAYKFFGTPFYSMPPQLRSGDDRIIINIPDAPGIYPMSLCYLSERIMIGACGGGLSASRGVRAKK